ncbi:erythroid membrane-associated protein isoform X2 [Xenopus laevis]|uniref:Erythroid membrane-associated protein isoform X2 n=1 Tax=Xenopus laevis TaxID=8355 RepID=A0A8J1LK42_XENLA|nr:erythroid membrane-associated protein isoform X2 [Xenopus laevis]
MARLRLNIIFKLMVILATLHTSFADCSSKDFGRRSCGYISRKLLAMDKRKTDTEAQAPAFGKKPTIHTQENNEAPTGYKTRICESSGWYPEPKIQWTDSEENTLKSEDFVKYIDNITLYRVSSSIKQDDCSPATCRIRNERLDITRQKSVVISIGCWAAHHILRLVAVTAAVAILMCVVCYCWYTCKRKCCKKSKKTPKNPQLL